MPRKFFLFILIFFALTAINPIRAFTIKPEEFIVSIYGENPWLPEECNQLLVNMLKRYENEQGTIIVNNKTRKAIWGHTFRTMQNYHRSSFEYKAALVIQRMVKKLHAENKKVQPECPICFDDPNHYKIELACSHSFCQPCLLAWYTQNESTEKGGHTTCPVCRVTILPRIQNSFQKLPAYQNMLNDNLIKKELAESERHQLEQLQAYQDDMNAWDDEDFNPFGRFNHGGEYNDYDNEFNLNVDVNINAIRNNRPANSDSSSENSDSEGSKDYPSSDDSDSDSSDSESSSSESSSDSSDTESSSSDET